MRNISLTTDGAIENAVRAMLIARKEAIARGMPLADEWSVRVTMSDEVGYEIFIKEEIFSKYAEKDATEKQVVKSLVLFIFGLIEEDLCDIQVSSKAVN